MVEDVREEENIYGVEFTLSPGKTTNTADFRHVGLNLRIITLPMKYKVRVYWASKRYLVE